MSTRAFNLFFVWIKLQIYDINFLSLTLTLFVANVLIVKEGQKHLTNVYVTIIKTYKRKPLLQYEKNFYINVL